MTGREQPYLMVVKDEKDFDTIAQNYASNIQTIRENALANNDLKMLGILEGLKTDKLTMDSIPTAREKYGLNFPADYAGVINAPESTTLNLDAYFNAMGKELTNHKGEVRYDIAIQGYRKIKDGRHLVTIEEGGKKKKYIANDLVVCTGSDISQTLEKLKELHDAAAMKNPGDCAPIKSIPERLRKENCKEVPQRVLHIELPSDAKRNALSERETVYFLDGPER